MRRIRFRKGSVRSAAIPRSEIYDFVDSRAYAVVLHYDPRADRIAAGYSLGSPLLPESWLGAEEDPLNGLWIEPELPVGYLLRDLPLARRFLNPRRSVQEAAAAVAADQLLEELQEIEAIL